nr:unnamed protein product [Callosobruchus analis]
MAFEKQFMVLLFIGGSLCSFLLVSLCIWLLISKHFNYLGNQIIHIITTTFEKLGKVLVLPAQQVYQPTYNLWTLNRL